MYFDMLTEGRLLAVYFKLWALQLEAGPSTNFSRLKLFYNQR